MDPTTVPTVEFMLDATCVRPGWHLWNLEGGAIEVTTHELRPVLEQAYDPGMPDWVALIDYDEESGWHVA